MIKKVKLSEIKPNPTNPRVIKDDKYKKLLKSIKEFPEMLDIRPIVVDENMIVLGGNMRLKACKEAGLEEVSIIEFKDLTEDKKKEFILKDNKSFGDWDWNILKEFEKETLLDSGFEEWDILGIFGDNEMEDKFTANIEGSNFNPEIVNVDDYIKQNILFFNEVMIEFEDDEVKKAIRNLNDISIKSAFMEDIKKIILQYGKNSL